MRRLLERYYSVGALLVLILVFGWSEPNFLTWDNAMTVLRQVSPLALSALGQAFVILVGGIDISVGAVMALSSVAASMGAARYGSGVGIGLGLAAGAAAGAVNGGAVTRFRIQPVIATIGMLSLARGLGFLLTDGQPVTNLPESFAAMGGALLLTIPIPLLLMLAVFGLAACWLTFVPSGRALFAIGGAEEAARLAGIPVRWLKPLAYILGGLCTALAAVVLTSWQGSGQPTLGYGWELPTIAAVVLGGTPLGGGRIRVGGTLIGAITIGVLSNGMDLTNVSPYVQEVILGCAIIAVVLIERLRQRSIANPLD